SRSLEIHTKVVRRGVEESGVRRIGARRRRTHPALSTGTNVLNVAFRGASLFAGVKYRSSSGEVNRCGPRHRHKRRSRQYLAGRTVQRVLEAILVERHERFAWSPADLEIG